MFLALYGDEREYFLVIAGNHSRSAIFLDIIENPSGKFDDVELKPLPDNIIGLKVIKTPGHTCGSVCFYFREGKILFSGDTKFSGATIGRTDLATSDPEMMSKSLETISKIGYEVICPGHNY